jgi:hypothetical protein
LITLTFIALSSGYPFLSKIGLITEGVDPAEGVTSPSDSNLIGTSVGSMDSEFELRFTVFVRALSGDSSYGSVVSSLRFFWFVLLVCIGPKTSLQLLVVSVFILEY